MKQRILVCGGRNFCNGVQLKVVLDECKKWFGEGFCIIHGNAPGADRLAGQWAREVGAPEIAMPANWEYYGKRAGTLRNTWMLHYLNPDLVIAFAGGSGTANMVKQARENNIDVYEVKL